jgi:Ser/Thr protein kinase RdoA (MazF antagonist)
MLHKLETGCLSFLRQGRKRDREAVMPPVAEIVSRYPVQRVGALVRLARIGGNYSQNYVLTTTQDKFVLKQYNHSDVPAIVLEHSVVARLNARRFPSPGVIANAQQQTYTEVDGQVYALYEFTAGRRWSDCVFVGGKREFALLEQAGRTLADYHRIVQGFSPPGRRFDGLRPDGQTLWRDHRWHMNVLDEWEQRVAGHGKQLSEGERFVVGRLDWLRHSYAVYGQQFEEQHRLLPKLVIHGDYAPHNVMVEGQRLAAVIDFGSARPDVRIQDVVWALQTFARRRIEAMRGPGIDERRAVAFLRAYTARCPLDDAEVELALLVWRLKNLRNLVWGIWRHPRRPLAIGQFRQRLGFLNWLEAHEEQVVRLFRASLTPG